MKLNLHQSKRSLTSSQATTVGPSHWAKGKPFLLASSNSSCLRGRGQKRRLKNQHVHVGLLTLCSAQHQRISSPAHGFPQVLAVTACVCSYTFYLPAARPVSLEKGAELYRSSLVPGSKEHRDTLDYTFTEFIRAFPDDSISKSGILTFNFILVAASLVLISCSVLEIRILK